MVPEDPEGYEAVEGGLTGKIEDEIELLKRHVEILKHVRDHEPIGIIKLSELAGEPQHKVRYSLRVLEEEGLIEPSTQGARSTDEVEAFIPRLKGLLQLMSTTVEELRRTFE